MMMCDMRVTIYLPDHLAQEVTQCGGDLSPLHTLADHPLDHHLGLGQTLLDVPPLKVVGVIDIVELGAALPPRRIHRRVHRTQIGIFGGQAIGPDQRPAAAMTDAGPP